MYKNIVYILIYLVIVLPTALSAEALKRYTVPQQEFGSTKQPDGDVRTGNVSEYLYTQFNNKIRQYTPQQKRALKKHLSAKREQALKNNNIEAVAYYERLIGILAASKY